MPGPPEAPPDATVARPRRWRPPAGRRRCPRRGRAHPARQAEAGHVGRADHTGPDRRTGGVAVQPGHRLDGVREHLAGGLVPVVQHTEAQRLGERERCPSEAGVVAEQVVRVREAGHGQAVLRLDVVDGVAAGQVARRFRSDRGATPQHLCGQVEGDPVARPHQEVHRNERLGSHGVHIGQGVGCGDPAPVVGIVDHRREEVGGHHHRTVSVDTHHRRVVAVLQTDDQVVLRMTDPEAGQHPLQLTRRHLAGAPAT